MLRPSRFAVTLGIACGLSGGCSINRETAPSRGTVHAATFVDPRSDASHGRVLRSKRWSPMLDPNDAESCGRCHDGAPARPASVTSSAPGAPACTTCHQEPEGALGCKTCHGSASLSPAHTAHVDGPHTGGLACATCHAVPGNPVIGGTHGNGTIEVTLDTFDASAKVCTTACHARGGARPAPAWNDTQAMTCGDCHETPPPQHFEGPCTGCHRETNATGTGFVVRATLHANGKVDLGDGSGKCGACHGRGDDPWPSTNAHPAHRAPLAAMAAPCASCHAIPTAFGPGTSHPRGGPATVAFAGLAVTRATPATYASGSCREVYCHGGGLEGTVAATPAWTDTSGSARVCGACHGTPPAAPHVASPACSLCHREGEATRHINGVVDRGGN